MTVVLGVLALVCACGDDESDERNTTSGGLEQPGFELDPESTVAFAPELVQAKFYKNMNSVPASEDYAFMMSQSQDAKFVASLRFDNDAVPATGVPFEVGGTSLPSVGPFFFSVNGNLRVLGGTLLYSAAGAQQGDLVSIVFDLDLEGGARLAARAAANLEIVIQQEQPPL